MVSLFILLISLIIFIGILAFIFTVLFWLLNPIFEFLNRVQYFIERPHRFFFKSKEGYKRVLYLFLFPFRNLIWFYLYLIATPLRVINAIYYNFFILTLWTTRDLILEVFHPQTPEYQNMTTSQYRNAWFFFMPKRIFVFICRLIMLLLDSLSLIIVDTVFPALTMYHGTDYNSSQNITHPNEWYVGDGNYAGTGLYFGIAKSTAEHYSRGVMIITRVTLGRNYPLACTPENIRNQVGIMGNSGDYIANWCKDKLITSVEHWREDKGWWEYCLIDCNRRQLIQTWRLRPLYVIEKDNSVPIRIYGGVSSWVSMRGSLIQLAIAIVILCLENYLFLK